MNAPVLEQPITPSPTRIERLNVAQFHRMIELGILPEGVPVELIDGILVRKDNSDSGGDPMTHGPKHAFCIQQLKSLEEKVKPHGYHLRQQLPITLSDNREPEPDVAIVRGTIADYLGHHPYPSDCVAVIEVADSSLEYDRTIKASLYAAAGILIYCIVNLAVRRIEIYGSPAAVEQRYTKQTMFEPGETIKLLLDGRVSIEIKVDLILP